MFLAVDNGYGKAHSTVLSVLADECDSWNDALGFGTYWMGSPNTQQQYFDLFLDERIKIIDIELRNANGGPLINNM